MIYIKQIEKDVLTLAMINVFIKTGDKKITDYIKEYNKEKLLLLTLGNLKDANDIDAKLSELANECYNRLKKKFK